MKTLHTQRLDCESTLQDHRLESGLPADCIHSPVSAQKNIRVHRPILVPKPWCNVTFSFIWLNIRKMIYKPLETTP
ncbi:hypothetical protein EG68_01545 [Paragonimus skrjabini miyazakii]|uniref:Uncharacterized protein n=1 Tax=Paragonimus skrjabini miyazakii TaxID=59628 RepID=A0A8S9Z7P6_9TREM|nr:hypothetical protein EG68_01545 [Paragonimus skrjabini miyazakii]